MTSTSTSTDTLGRASPIMQAKRRKETDKRVKEDSRSVSKARYKIYLMDPKDDEEDDGGKKKDCDRRQTE